MSVQPLTGSDWYEAEIDESWLEGESIASVVWSCPDVVIKESSFTGNIAKALLERGAATGIFKILLTVTTVSERSVTLDGRLEVKDSFELSS